MGAAHPALGLQLAADGGAVRRVAEEHRVAGLVELLDADLGAQERLLRERGDRRLAHLRIVEGLVQVVEAGHVLQADVRDHRQLQVRVLLDGLVEIETELLDDVDLALLQRGDLRLTVAQREIPFDAVDVDALAAGGARRRLAARHVLVELGVDRLVARLELVALEDVRARADVLLDLLERVGLGDTLGHDEGDRRARLAERLEHEAAGLAEEDPEGVGRGRVHPRDELHQRRAHRVALAPAADRGDHVVTGDRLAVVPQQAATQLEGVEAVVGADGPGVDHLGLDLPFLVGAEQRVVDHVAVVAAHVGGCPDRVEHGEVRVRHDPQHVRLGVRRRHRGDEGRRSGETQRTALEQRGEGHGEAP